jgi:hypothetical protein
MVMKNKYFIMILLMLVMDSVFAQSPTSSTTTGLMADLGTMFANGTQSFVSLTNFVQAFSMVIGIFLVMGSVLKFSQLGTDPRLSPKVPIIMFFSGIALFSLMSVVDLVSGTLAMGNGPGDILMTNTASFQQQTVAAIQGVLTFVRLVGYIAFIRGWLILNRMGQGDNNATIGKAITHICGGVAAINSELTATILRNTFSPSTPLPF